MADTTGCLYLLRSLVQRDDWRKLQRADVLYVCHDADRTHAFAGKRYAPVIDTIQDALSAHGLRGLTIAAPYAVHTGAKSHGNVLGFNRSFARGRLPRGLGGTSRSGVETWARILAAVRPRGVIAVQPPRGLCEAGKRAGVWVADAQHGWICSGAHAGEGYYCRSYWGVDGPFPDYFLVWDDASAGYLCALFAPRPVKALRIGNMWCERFARNDPRDPVVQEIAGRQPSRNPRILITLQWKMVTIDHSLPATLQRVIRNTASKYEWIIRLHPCHTNSRSFAAAKEYLELDCGIGNAVTWQAPTERPLPAVLSEVDLHITYNSSSALEASYLNVMTGFVDQRLEVLRSGMSHLLDHGLAEVMPTDAEGIESWLRCQLAERQERTRPPLSPPDRAAFDLMSLLRGDAPHRP